MTGASGDPVTRHDSAPVFFGRPREGRSLFPFPQTGNGAPGGARGLARPPHGRPLAIGFASTPFGSGVMSPAPGAPPSLRSEGAAPPGAPFGSGLRSRADLTADAGCLPARRSAAGPIPASRRGGQMADCGYIFLYRMIVNK